MGKTYRRDSDRSYKKLNSRKDKIPKRLKNPDKGSKHKTIKVDYDSGTDQIENDY